MTIRVVIADDQPLLRSGFRALICADPDFEVAGEAADGREAVRLARTERADVVLMDIRMPVLDGLAATRLIVGDPELAGVKVLILTTFEIDEYVFEALRGLRLSTGFRYRVVMSTLYSRDVTQDPRRLLRFARTSSADPPDSARPPRHARRRHRSRRQRAGQAALVLGLLSVVVAVDQSAKWWAWRHVGWSRINAGGDVLVGHTVSGWFAAPATGTLLDLLNVGLLGVIAWGLARFRAAASVLVPGALMTAGWVSNLLDRLGIHEWTAPGSDRGVVDFIHLGPHYYNLADFFIIGCTPLFALAVGYQGGRAVRRLVTAGRVPGPALYRQPAPVAAPGER